MECAFAWAKRATCQRLNVGAVIVSNGNIISHGYNGARAGELHCLGDACPGKFECHETVHAEANAIARIPVGLGPQDIYCTDSPCPACAHLIVATGIKRVFFATPYRITFALEWLISKDREVYRLLPAGYLIEWSTKNLVEMDK